ncbi:MAG: tRNA (adenosine(37)-N6)-threonylcarbamoyltransferase complex dimerization subunit type 1 TsaB [Pseudomonadota bacterium]|nr:tRNA (adenosine(37)-N6)-threonylcarbamoyltransferase complex dimerization subunit type 1 TsaB [Pseudomonadota bacterium]
MNTNPHLPALAIDTLSNHLSGSLFCGDLVYNQSVPSKKHANVITELIASLCQQAGISVKDLSYLVVNVGPGSFTGLRIGISTVQALAHALSIPILPLSNNLCLAYHGLFIQLNQKKPLDCFFATLIDARLSQVYFSVYGCNDSMLLSPVVNDSIFDYDKLPAFEQYSEVYTCGEAWQTYSDRIPTAWHNRSFVDCCLPDDLTSNGIPSAKLFEKFYSRSHIMIAIFLHIQKSQTLPLIEASELRANYVRNDVAKKKST